MLHISSEHVDNQYPGKHVHEICTPLHPTFMYKNWGFAGVTYTYFILIFDQTHILWVLV